MASDRPYNPWAELGRRTHITCVISKQALPSGDGWWLPEVDGIVLDLRLDRVGRRCVLAHELEHEEAGDVQVVGVGPDGPRQARRQEQRADEAAARRLVALPALAAAVAAHPDDPHAVADALDVTEHVLRVRLLNLDLTEQQELSRAVANAEHAA